MTNSVINKGLIIAIIVTNKGLIIAIIVTNKGLMNSHT